MKELFERQTVSVLSMCMSGKHRQSGSTFVHVRGDWSLSKYVFSSRVRSLILTSWCIAECCNWSGRETLSAESRSMSKLGWYVGVIKGGQRELGWTWTCLDLFRTRRFSWSRAFFLDLLWYLQMQDLECKEQSKQSENPSWTLWQSNTRWLFVASWHGVV